MSLLLAISSYRNDDEVEALCLAAASEAGRALFSRVLVVDSQGSGRLPRFLVERRLEEYVDYHSFPENLGAAGNLWQRLRLGADSGCEYLFAINHDGELDLEAVKALRDRATAQGLAAAYPLREIEPDLFDITGSRPFPTRSIRRRGATLPPEEAVPAFWSSSNGSLYSLEPARLGVLPDRRLWHGWEDLQYGLALAAAGYRQEIVLGARLASSYDFQRRSLAGRHLVVSDKDAWLSYYFARNLLLIATRSTPSGARFAGAVARILGEMTATIALRDDRLSRLGMILRGTIDGLVGRGGRRVEPGDARR